VTEIVDTPPTFADLGVRPETVAALAAADIIFPFPIQAMTLPLALAGNDLIGQAKTGTGKTLGFGIPMVDRVTSPDDPEWASFPTQGKPQALVVVPTRELCLQVSVDLDRAGARRGVRVVAVFGGRSMEEQIAALRTGAEIVVGTPGRLLDLARQRALDLSQVGILCLDEADEMLDLGFLPDVERILTLVPSERQTMLFSATMPGEIISLARRFMTQPTHIRAQMPDDEGHTVAAVEQHVFRAHPLDKIEMLARILQSEGLGQTMIFCRTKRTTQKVADELRERGFAAGAVHGDLSQAARESALALFREGKVNVLVATDVAARGIDVEGVTHVINHHCPDDEKTYLHRIGRTGRAGAGGVAITFVDWDEMARWSMINRALELPFEEPIETYSSSPHLYTQLRIPAGAKGSIGEAQPDLSAKAGGRPPRRDDGPRRQGTGRSARPARGGSRPAAPRESASESEPKARRPRNRTRTRRPEAGSDGASGG
jgi:superfamily II DNA/RNA helicase